MMDTPAGRLKLRLFGYPEVERDDLAVRLPRRKALALLAYLGMCPTGAGRETLAALLWPGYDQEQAAAYVRQALWELNKALGKGALSAEAQLIQWSSAAELWVDVRRFEEALDHWKGQKAEGDRQTLDELEEVVALYRGDFMAGFTLRDSAAFDDWQVSQAEALRARLGEALVMLAERYIALGDLDMAIASLQRWLVVDPLDEARHRDLMRFYAWAGQRSAALRQYETCVAQLRQELEASPEAATRELAEQIRSGMIRPRGKKAVSASPPATTSASTPRLGAQVTAAVTPFVGREAELAQLGRILAGPSCRLLTLLGPGGIGKTRLAMQFAGTQQEACPHGVVLVSLAACASGEQMVGAIAEALHLSFRQGPGSSLTLDQEKSQLCDYLRPRATLLVLDSMEHLTSIATLLSDLLAEAPGLKLLVTSRERLALPEEWVMEVQGLPYPTSYGGERDTLSGAMQLFVKCAQRARANLLWHDADWPAMARICQLVEGVPLGIELAAAWVGIFSCEEIAGELARDLSFLVSRQRGTPERHVSLRAAFEHSWKLLPEAERNAFAQLAVFQGGFARSAAAQVARASLEMLSALADKSLLRRDAQGHYSLHQVLWQYAAEALEHTPAVRAGTLERHSAYYLDLLETIGQRLMGAGQQEALETLKIEADNLRLALHTAVECHDWERLQQSLAFWILFLEMCGSRGAAWEALAPLPAMARQAFAHEPDCVAIHAVLAFVLVAQHYFSQTDTPSIREVFYEGLNLAMTLPDSLEKAFVFLLVSIRSPLPMEESRVYSQRALVIFENFKHRWGQATAHLVWADATSFRCGAYDEAEGAYQASKAIFEALGNRWGQALCLTGLSYIAFQRQQYEQATHLAQAGLAIYRALNDLWRIGNMRSYLARYAAAMGDYDSAERYQRENLEAALNLGQRDAAAQVLEYLGRIASLQGDLSGCRSYYEQSLALYRQMGDSQGEARIVHELEALAG